MSLVPCPDPECHGGVNTAPPRPGEDSPFLCPTCNGHEEVPEEVADAFPTIGDEQ